MKTIEIGISADSITYIIGNKRWYINQEDDPIPDLTEMFEYLGFKVETLGGLLMTTVTLSKHEMVIDKSEYEELLNQAMRAEALDSAGVDNWSGYDYACEIYRDMKEDNV